MTPSPTAPDRPLAILLTLHVVALFAGFTLLGPVFQFPDVLRWPASERFALFSENQSAVVPVYWVLTMTGLTQVAISVLLYHALDARHRAAGTLALIFGSLAGLCQALGFGRWVILIPYLAGAAGVPGNESDAALMEGAFNHYAGMLIGEHLANICWGIWLAAVSVILLGSTGIGRVMGWLGLGLAPLLLVLAGEQIGLSGPVLDPLVDFGFPMLALWYLLLAAGFWRRNGAQTLPALGRGLMIGGGVLMAFMLVPALV